jgi:hypothetical protein
MEQQYEVTVLLHVSFVTTVPVSACSATDARALIKAQWNDIGASLEGALGDSYTHRESLYNRGNHHAQ